MPRARNIQNRGYPKSWRFRYDAYYYRVPKGQEHLGDGKKDTIGASQKSLNPFADLILHARNSNRRR
jgi:hypothetical protein